MGKNISTEELKEAYEKSFSSFTPGEIVKGRIVKRIGNNVLVDLGIKSEALLPIEEFRDPEEIKEGKEVTVFLEALEGVDGMPAISKRKADFHLAWETIKERLESGEGVKAKIYKKVKGGLTVDLVGLDAFLPGSQIDIRPVSNLDSYIGKELEMKIVKVNWSKKNIVVSRRLLLEERQKVLREEVLSKIKVGDVVEGEVRNITDFGVFVDIGGIDALLHITDISWNRVVHPSAALSQGQKVKVKVLTVDPSSGRIAVGLKQLVPHPWDAVEKKYPIGSKVKGKVTSLAEYGAFIELEKGVEGLIHVSEMSWTKSIHHPAQILKIDQLIEAVVLNIDKENRRISLGLKQTEPDPWSLVEEKYSVGQRVQGRVKSLKDFGAFVEIEEGIEGLVRNIDLSWTKKVTHPREALKRNQKIEAVILNIDQESRRIGLGLKQCKEDPLYGLSQEYKEGDKIKAEIVDLPPSGVVVNLGYEGLEGFIPLQELERKDMKRPKDRYAIGEELNLVIRRINLQTRKIVLSERAFYRKKKEKEVKKEPSKAVKKEKKEKKREKFPIKEHLR